MKGLQKPDARIAFLLVALGLMSASVHHRLCGLTVKAEGFETMRLEHHNGVLSGVIMPPYRYRVLAPVAAEALQALLSPFVGNGPEKKAQRLAIAYFLIVFGSLAIAYGLFFACLRQWFDPRAALVGCLFLAAVVPLSITGYFMDDDFITLVLYALGFWLFMTARDSLLPFVVFIGTFNREQIAFLVVLWLAYHLANGTGGRRRTIAIALGCMLGFAVPYLSLRYLCGSAPTMYTISFHAQENLAHLGRIAGSWSVQVLAFAVLALLGLRRAPAFLRYALATLPVYILAFFLKGKMWELGKALPMYLILIPLSLFALFPPAEKR
ncbi:MAG: hypothetical protein FJ279_00665 [Planctomycetes bacterium]|nr:hypothetical protein [Planctomycetota bacterium]